MRLLCAIFVLLMAGGCQAPQPDAAEAARAGDGPRKYLFPVALELSTSREGDRTLFELAVEVDPHWHINSNSPLQEFLVPTELQVPEGASYSLVNVEYPEPRALTFGFFPEPLSVFEGHFVITGELKGASPGETIRLDVSTQACDNETCLPPETHRLSVE